MSVVGRSGAVAVSQNQSMIESVSVYINDLIASQSDPFARTGVDAVTTRPDPKFPSFDFFCAEREPGISVRKYVERIVNYMRCTPECFVFAMAYIRRAVDAGFPIHLRSIHRLLLTAVVVAVKTRDDHYYSMTYYAQVGGVTAADLNGMELKFLLDVIDFQADVPLREYRYVISDMNQAVVNARTQAGQTASLKGAIQKAMSGGSLSEDAQGLSGGCSVESTPPANYLKASTVCPDLQLHMSAASVIAGRRSDCEQVKPAPSWVTDCHLYW